MNANLKEYIPKRDCKRRTCRSWVPVTAVVITEYCCSYKVKPKKCTKFDNRPYEGRSHCPTVGETAGSRYSSKG